MPINITWEDAEHTIVRFDFDGAWNWLDFRAAIDASQANSRDERIYYVIVNLIDAPVPQDMLTIGRHATTLSTHNVSAIFLVTGKNALLKTIGHTFNALYKNQFPDTAFVVTNTLAETRACIEQMQTKHAAF